MNSGKPELTQHLADFSRQRGADLFGIADITPVHDFIASQADTNLRRFPRAISMGMQLCGDIVEQHTPDQPRRQSLYWHHVYEVVNRALDCLAYDVARWLDRLGFSAFPVPASTPYNLDKLKGAFSHKLAAHLAGVGWIGKSCLLLTDRFGPRVRLVTVLTDAPLEAGRTLDKPCGQCRVCVESCPIKAFTGVEFQAGQGREVRFDVFKCSEYRREHPCGLCVSSCPKGRSRVSQG